MLILPTGEAQLCITHYALSIDIAAMLPNRITLTKEGENTAVA